MGCGGDNHKSSCYLNKTVDVSKEYRRFFLLGRLIVSGLRWRILSGTKRNEASTDVDALALGRFNNLTDHPTAQLVFGEYVCGSIYRISR